MEVGSSGSAKPPYLRMYEFRRFIVARSWRAKEPFDQQLQRWQGNRLGCVFANASALAKEVNHRSAVLPFWRALPLMARTFICK